MVSSFKKCQSAEKVTFSIWAGVGRGEKSVFRRFFSSFSLLYFVVHTGDFNTFTTALSPVSFVTDSLTGHQGALSTSLAGEEKHINDRNSQLQFQCWAISSFSQLSSLHFPIKSVTVSLQDLYAALISGISGGPDVQKQFNFKDGQRVFVGWIFCNI